MGIRFGFGIIRKKTKPDEKRLLITIKVPSRKKVILIILLAILLSLIPLIVKSMTPTQRQRCTVYSRVVGYLSPVNQWNKGKAEEWKDRKTFDSALIQQYEKRI